MARGRKQPSVIADLMLAIQEVVHGNTKNAVNYSVLEHEHDEKTKASNGSFDIQLNGQQHGRQVSWNKYPASSYTCHRCPGWTTVISSDWTKFSISELANGHLLAS